MKTILLFLLTTISGTVFGQIEVSTGTLSKTLSPVATYERLSNNFAPHVTELYAIHFEDGTTGIYDADEDILYPERFYAFQKKHQAFVASAKDHWYIYFEDDGFISGAYGWVPVDSIELNRFDSISGTDYHKFAGYKGTAFELFSYDDASKARSAYATPIHGQVIHSYPSAHGLFVKDQAGEIHFIDIETGTAKSEVLIDTMLNKPTAFVENVLVSRDGKSFVYCFSKNELIEPNAMNAMLVPIYDYPLVLTEKYVAFGDDEWVRIPATDPYKVTFESEGDFVEARVHCKDGSDFGIDLWEKTRID